jgi:hypothetical protein
MRIRRATPDDIGWLIDQVKEFLEFAEYDSLYDPEYLPHLVAECVTNHFVLVAEDKGERLGMLAGMLQPHPYNPKKKMLAELCWWVPRNHRHSRAGLALLTTYMEWGKKNADIVTMCSMVNSPINSQALVKRGFKAKEQTFVWEKE